MTEDIKDLYNSLKIDENMTADIIFEEDRVRDTYLDKYNGIHVEISQVTKFDESTDLSDNIFRKDRHDKRTSDQGRRKISNHWTRVYKW